MPVDVVRDSVSSGTEAPPGECPYFVAIYCIILDYFHCILGGATPRVGRMFGIRYHLALRRHLVNALTYMII